MDWLDMNKLNRFGNKHRDRYTCVSSLMSISMHLRESMNNYFCGFLARHFRDPQTWTSLALWLRIGPNLWLLGTEFTLQRLLRLQIFELATPSPLSLG